MLRLRAGTGVKIDSIFAVAEQNLQRVAAGMFGVDLAFSAGTPSTRMMSLVLWWCERKCKRQQRGGPATRLARGVKLERSWQFVTQ